MKKTLFLLAAFILSASVLPAADEAAVRVYVLKHKRVEEAALLIRPHLSDSASITLTQRLNAMTVTDRPEKLDQIGKVLAAFDTPPRGFTFAVKLVRARADVPEGSIAREIGGLGAKLKSMFQFNDYALIDSVVLRAAEGGTGRHAVRRGVHALLHGPHRGRRQRAPAFALQPLQGLQVRRAERRVRCVPSTAPRCP